MSNLTVVSTENFKSEVLDASAHRPVLVDFYADWCGPCRMLAPVLESVSAERQDVTIVKVDVDQSSQIASAYKIQSIPTMILFVNGREVSRGQGTRRTHVESLLNG